MKNLFLLTIIILCSTITYSQKDSTQTKRISINEFYFFPANSIGKSIFSTASDFQKLAPNSLLLNKDFTNYSHNSSFKMHPVISPSLNLMVGFKFRNLKHSSLRVGFGYASGTSLSTNYINENSSIYDTVVSTKTGQKSYLYSNYTDKYSMKNTYEQIRLDVSYIFKAKLGERVSIYTGLGGTFGIIFNDLTEIQHSNTITYDGSEQDVSTISSEAFKNKNSYSYSAYVPLGIDFIVCNKSELLKRVHLFIESRPTINFINISGLSTYTNASMQSGLGIKIKL